MKERDALMSEADKAGYFGRKYDAPVYKELPRTATPVGEKCMHCEEPFKRGDDGFSEASGYVHRACRIRLVLGSVGHQMGRCSCYVKDGTSFEDPPGMTRREAAEAALTLYETGRRPPGL